MRRIWIGGVVVAAVAANTLFVGTREVQASKPFRDMLNIACAKCHKSQKEAMMSYDDLTDGCGKAALKALEAKGYKSHDIRKNNEAEGKKWGQVLKTAKFKCP